MGLEFTAICARVAMFLFTLVRVLTSTEGKSEAGEPATKSRLAEQARRSQAIVRGRVRLAQAFRGRGMDGEELILTRAILDVRECLKGVTDTCLELLVEGGTLGGITVRPLGIPGVNDGDELVVFVDRGRADHPIRGLKLFKLAPSRRVLGLGLTFEDLREVVRRAKMQPAMT